MIILDINISHNRENYFFIKDLHFSVLVELKKETTKLEKYSFKILYFILRIYYIRLSKKKN
jgi:hypothetical protein